MSHLTSYERAALKHTETFRDLRQPAEHSSRSALFSTTCWLTRHKILCVFQKYNADYDLSAKEGADSLAFISLMEEKLKPALVRNKDAFFLTELVLCHQT